MADPFANLSAGGTSSAQGIYDITPNDGVDLPTVVRGLHCRDAAGIVKVTMVDGSVGTIAIGIGDVNPLRVKRVWVTGTTATGLVGYI